ncbi:cytochrome ubiquinol oxidase subunit I [Umezawaea sp. NPDC059074]|uniref:cytochrome ubiquinol oxidase subunit I n=1 Tax=Umezawaea sp. NPDC059074 TaxID=3346716 RepID=UPI0036B82932
MDADTLDLARAQFALTAATHFLFVGLTLGLATLVTYAQTRATLSRSPVHERMVRFWGQLYVVNYAVGIVTGLVMEFQLGLNWGGLGHFAGNVFGSSLALETLTAFFVESTFLGLWIFGWGRLNRWAHLATIWVVTLTGYASAYWIMVSNGFLQHPVGSQVVDGVLKLTDAAAVLTNPSAVVAFGHVLGGSLVTGGLVMAGVSAYHLRREASEFFQRSLRLGLVTALIALPVTVYLGSLHFGVIDDTQPLKGAVFDGDLAKITQLQGEAVGRFGPGDYAPSAFWANAGIVMMACWVAMVVVVLVGLTTRGRATARKRLLVVLAGIPLPFVALVAGWVFRESGRQPWVVYGLLRTRDAVSDLTPLAMRTSLITFTALFAALAVVNYWLLARYARRGPDSVALGPPVDDHEPVPAPTF